MEMKLDERGTNYTDSTRTLPIVSSQLDGLEFKCDIDIEPKMFSVFLAIAHVLDEEGIMSFDCVHNICHFYETHVFFFKRVSVCMQKIGVEYLVVHLEKYANRDYVLPFQRFLGLY